MNQHTKTLEIAGGTYTVHIPNDEVFKDAFYDDAQAARTIYINLDAALQDTITLHQLESLIEIKGSYLMELEALNKNINVMDDTNVAFLEEQAQAAGLQLSTDDIITIFNTEMFYLKLINVVD